MSKKYRYITNGSVTRESRICDFRLIGGNQLKSGDGRSSTAVRVQMPNNLKLEKWSCDNYSTTEDERTIDELGYDIVVRINGKLVVRNDLKEYDFGELSSILTQKESLYFTKEGYLDKPHYTDYLRRLDERNETIDQETERIINALDNKQCCVSDLKYIDTEVLLKVLNHYVNKKRINK